MLAPKSPDNRTTGQPDRHRWDETRQARQWSASRDRISRFERDGCAPDAHGCATRRPNGPARVLTLPILERSYLLPPAELLSGTFVPDTATPSSSVMTGEATAHDSAMQAALWAPRGSGAPSRTRLSNDAGTYAHPQYLVLHSLVLHSLVLHSLVLHSGPARLPPVVVPSANTTTSCSRAGRSIHEPSSGQPDAPWGAHLPRPQDDSRLGGRRLVRTGDKPFVAPGGLFHGIAGALASRPRRARS